mmetsp:Transcript_37257/g.89033  ORF Transcript_37257/g.89033 Transcript_37257/m.89033 type:complete len:289 (-) Transcript_37257:110-976(-)
MIVGTFEQDTHARQVVFGMRLQSFDTYRFCNLSWIVLAPESCSSMPDNIRVREVSLRNPVTNQQEKVGIIAIKASELRIAGHWSIFRTWASCLLELRVSESAGNRQFAVHPCNATGCLLDSAATAIDSLALCRVARLVVGGQALVSSSTVYYSAISPAEKDATVTSIGNSDLALATDSLLHDAHRCSRPTGLPCSEEGCVDVEHHLSECCIVSGAAMPVKVFPELGCHEGGTHVATVAIQDGEEAPLGLRDHDMRVLHVAAPSIHLASGDAEPFGPPLFDCGGLHRHG